MSVKSMGEMGKDFCPNFLNLFLENIKEDCISSPRPRDQALEEIDNQILTDYMQCRRGFLLNRRANVLIKRKRLRQWACRHSLTS